MVSIEWFPDTGKVSFAVPDNPIVSRYLVDQLDVLVKNQTGQYFAPDKPIIKKPNLINSFGGLFRRK